MIIDNRKGLGSIILALTPDELEYLVYTVRLDDWRPDAVSDPIAHSLCGKIRGAVNRGVKK